MLSIGQAIQKRKINLWCILTSGVVYVINKGFLMRYMTGVVGYFCRCHLNDLVCPLFFLGYCQILLIWIGHEIVSYKHCMFLGMAGGLVWEYVAPVINPQAISDPIDLMCYFAGANIYFILLKQELIRSERNE